jgi:hypothetical protein
MGKRHRSNAGETSQYDQSDTRNEGSTLFLHFSFLPK